MTDTATPEVDTRQFTPQDIAVAVAKRIARIGDFDENWSRAIVERGIELAEDGAFTITTEGGQTFHLAVTETSAQTVVPDPSRPRLLLGYTVPDHVRWSAFGRAIDVSCLVDVCKLNGAAKRFLVPALGDATKAIDWLKEHAHGVEVVEYRAEPVGGHAPEHTLTLPIDWCDQLREVHKHELTGSDKIRAISQAISIISNWLQPAGGAR